MANSTIAFKIINQPYEVVIGTPIVLEIETNAESYEVENKNETNATFDKETRTLTGLAQGGGQFVFKCVKGSKKKDFTLNVNIVESATNITRPDKFFLGEKVTSIDIGKSVVLSKATELYDSDAVVTIESNKPNTISVIQNDDNTYTLQAVGMGDATISINAYKTITIGDISQKIDATEYSEEWEINVVAFEKAKLEVSPQLSVLLEGHKQKLHIDTTYENVEISSSNPNVIAIEKETLIAKKLGKSVIGIRGSSPDKLDSYVSFECVIANELPTQDEPDREIYDYDDELPTNLSDGAIVYKTGSFENSPVIEYKFNGKTKKYSCIGIKFLKVTDDGEPHSIAFMAEDGTVDDVMYRYKVKLMELGVEEILYEKIKDTINADVKYYLHNKDFIYNKNRLTAFSSPKWVGLLFNDTCDIGRRLNTCGLEEDWTITGGNLNEFLPNMNHASNNDPITQLFDSVEPYKSFKRMAFLNDDFRIGKYAFMRKRIYYKNAETLAMHEDGYNLANFLRHNNNNMQDLERYAFFNLMKKSYYIDIELRLNGNIYYLKCIGSEPFFVDIADYIDVVDREQPNMEIKCFNSRVSDNSLFGVYEYKVEGSKIYANLHPLFYDFYNTDGTVLSSEAVDSYKGDNAYPDRETKTNDINSITMDYRYISSFGAHYTGNEYFKPTYNKGHACCNSFNLSKQKCYEFGKMAQIGINYTPANLWHIHLMWLMKEIEYGNLYTHSYNKCLSYNKWHMNNTSSLMQKCDTLHMGNTTGIYNKKLCYRGIEHYIGFYYIMFGYKNLSPQKLMIPHSHLIPTFDDNLLPISFSDPIRQDIEYDNYNYKSVAGCLCPIEADPIHSNDKYDIGYAASENKFFGLTYGNIFRLSVDNNTQTNNTIIRLGI